MAMEVKSHMEQLQAYLHTLCDQLEDAENHASSVQCAYMVLARKCAQPPGLHPLPPTKTGSRYTERLEMDRVHIALTHQQPYGLPCDVVVNFNYHGTKERTWQAT